MSSLLLISQLYMNVDFRYYANFWYTAMPILLTILTGTGWGESIKISLSVGDIVTRDAMMQVQLTLKLCHGNTCWFVTHLVPSCPHLDKNSFDKTVWQPSVRFLTWSKMYKHAKTCIVLDHLILWLLFYSSLCIPGMFSKYTTASS